MVMETIDELLAKYMLGEAKLADIEAIDKWISASKHNLKYFTHFKLIWETSAVLKIESNIDVEKAWEEFKELTEKNSNRSATIRQLYPKKRWMLIATIWISFFGIAGLLYAILHPGRTVTLALQTTNQVRIDTLMDGSVITLNKNSILYYPDRFSDTAREVKLDKGEAFFNIAPDKRKPFLIRVNDVLIKVTGTSFNIKNARENTEVIVKSGIVQVSRRKVTIKLNAGEKLNINYYTGELKKEPNTDELYNYYYTHQFVLNNTPLWRIAEVLNGAYNVNIVIPDKKMADCTLNTTFRDGPLDDMLNVIEQTLEVHIVKYANMIIIQ
jgi:ferric-dicitrate binding protein FerR (iron transport regulator)